MRQREILAANKRVEKDYEALGKLAQYEISSDFSSYDVPGFLKDTKAYETIRRTLEHHDEDLVSRVATKINTLGKSAVGFEAYRFRAYNEYRGPGVTVESSRKVPGGFTDFSYRLSFSHNPPSRTWPYSLRVQELSTVAKISHGTGITLASHEFELPGYTGKGVGLAVAVPTVVAQAAFDMQCALEQIHPEIFA